MDLQESTSAGKRKRNALSRQHKKSTKVDLTPMVDLGFLLVTFFFVTTTWARPGTFKIILPANGDSTHAVETASISLIPLAGNSIFYYEGSLASAILSGEFGKVDYSLQQGIGNIIRRKQSALDKNPKFKEGRKELVVIIKPTAKSSFANIVKTLDEMAINKVSRFALEEIDEEEKKLLRTKGLQ